jgi:hypothetical protein
MDARTMALFLLEIGLGAGFHCGAGMGVISVHAVVSERLQKGGGEDQLGILELMNGTTIRQDCHRRTDSEDGHHPSSPARSRPKITIAPTVLTL